MVGGGGFEGSGEIESLTCGSGRANRAGCALLRPRQLDLAALVVLRLRLFQAAPCCPGSSGGQKRIQEEFRFGVVALAGMATVAS